MTKDAHLISEAYLSSKKVVNEQTPAPAPAAAPAQQPPAAPAQQPVAAPVQQPSAPAQQSATAPKASKEQEKAVNDLLKAFDLPESAAPYLLQTLLQNVPALKAQYGM